MRVTGLVLFIVTLCATSTYAQVKPGDALLLVNVGYSNGKAAATANNIDGGFFFVDYQKMDWDTPFSAGFGIGYGEIQETVTEDSTQTSYTINTLPIYLGGKYWMGKDKLQAYVGLAFGMYFADLEGTFTSTTGPLTIGGEYSVESTAGLGMAIPVGATFAVGETLLVNVNYMLNWLWGNEFLDGDVMHSLGVGAGIQFGPK